jgi:precorrin-8X/cobalt-precorrin-8 methylmutase
MKGSLEMKPAEIENLSFQIIDSESGPHPFPPDQWPIVRRIIHTSADFEYLESIRFHPEAVRVGIEAIRRGCTVVTDTNMAKVGMREKDLNRFGVSVKCYMSDPKVGATALKKGTTRAVAAVDAAADEVEDGIYVVGNAPTALLHLIDLMRQAKCRPALVVGFPVGFVNAAESKAALVDQPIPYITNIGRKGGSNVAAAILNALVILALENS